MLQTLGHSKFLPFLLSSEGTNLVFGFERFESFRLFRKWSAGHKTENLRLVPSLGVRNHHPFYQCLPLNILKLILHHFTAVLNYLVVYYYNIYTLQSLTACLRTLNKAFWRWWKWSAGFESETLVKRQKWSAGHETENLHLVPSLLLSMSNFSLRWAVFHLSNIAVFHI